MNQKQVFELMEKFKECGLGALTLETEGFKISLKDKSDLAPIVSRETTAPFHSSAGSEAPAAPESAAARSSEGGPKDSPGSSEFVTAPIVGSFYRSPGPDSPPFVEEGSKVEAGDSMCIIEAMKIMNKLEAEFACEIVRVLAQNGQMVEYGEPLFEVRRR